MNARATLMSVTLLSIRLVHPITLPIERDLGLVVSGDTTIIYAAINYDVFSFEITTIDYREKDLKYMTLINETIQIIKDIPLDTHQKPGIMLKNMIYDIEKAIISIKENYRKISEYQGTDFHIPIEQCHTNVTYILDQLDLTLYTLDLKTLIDSLDVDINKDKILDDKSSNFIKFRNTIAIMKVHANDFELKTRKYLNILRSLKHFEINDSLFELLENTPCLQANPFMDEIQLDECHFLPKKIVCKALVGHPTNETHFKKAIAIPYNKYQLSLNNVFFKENDKKLYKVYCRKTVPIFANCEIEEFDKDCDMALLSKNVDSILEDCPFVKYNQINPIISQDGIIFPDASNFTISVVNETNLETLYLIKLPDLLNISANFPIIISTNDLLIANNDQIKFAFAGFEKNRIRIPVFSDPELKKLLNYIGIFSFTQDEIEWITSGALSGTVGILGILGIVLLVKLIRIKKDIKSNKIKQKKKIPKRLENFLKE